MAGSCRPGRPPSLARYFLLGLSINSGFAGIKQQCSACFISSLLVPAGTANA